MCMTCGRHLPPAAEPSLGRHRDGPFAGIRFLLLVLCVAIGVADAGPVARADPRPDGVAATQKRIYIANDDHTDYFWTGTDVQYRAAFLNMLDYYMDQAEATAGNPSDARGRFNCDGSLWAWEYQHNRSQADFERLMSHVRAGTISMPLQTCVMLYGAMPAEAVLRNMYYAGRLERAEGLDMPLVVAMENQTLPGGVASLWAGSGARYSWRGICNCATHINAGSRPREIYHFRGPDGQSVCMKWNSWEGAGNVGGYAEARDVTGTVSYLDSDSDFLSRWPYPISGAFGYGADDLQTTTSAFVNASLSLSNANRRVIVSNEQDFFEDFIANHGGDIPIFSGSFGNEWDLYTASMGEVTADFKRHVEKLRTAEAVATVVSFYDPTFMDGREGVRDSAFLACGLFYEHDWTADGPVPRAQRAQFQRNQLQSLKRYVNPLLSDALTALGQKIVNPGGAERHMVFNPLSWARTDFADLAVQQSWPVHVLDVTTGGQVPCQQVVVDGAPRVRILATDVPSVGYKTYEVRSGAGTTFPPSATVQLPAVDNSFYKVTLGSRGQIVSLLDHKDADRELADASNGGIHDLGTGSGSVTVENTGPVSTTLRVVAPGTPDHTTRVTLYGGIDRVAFEGLVTENFSLTVGYRSAFTLPGATMRHEEVGMIARVARAAQGGDYADQNTRTDYLTFNHFVDMSQATRGVTVSNWDSPFFAAGNSTIGTLDASPIIRAIVGMQIDGTAYGIANQGDDTQFLDRFALRTHGAYDPGGAMRFALEHQNPLVTARVGLVGGSLPQDRMAFLTVDSPDVMLWALKPAEEGIGQGGVIARVWNVADAQRTMNLEFIAGGIVSARRTTHIETDLGPISTSGDQITDVLARQQMSTYRLIPSSGVLAAPPSRRASIALSVFPNPAPPGAPSTISYSLPASGKVRVTVLDVAGKTVATLTDGTQPPGSYRMQWSGRIGKSGEAAPGIYFVRLEAGDVVRTGKLVRLK